MTQHQYVDAEVIGNKLRFTLLPIQDDDITPESDLWDVLEYHLCNGWTWIEPRQIGALTEAPIIARDVEMNDDGDILFVDHIYWYPEYAILDPVAELFEHGFVEFTRHFNR